MTPKIESTQELIEQLTLITESFRSSTFDLDVYENLATTQRMLDNLTISQDTIDPTTKELQDKLAQLKAEAKTITEQSEESQIAALVREKEQFDQSVEDTIKETRDSEAEIRRLRQELYQLEHHDDEIEMDVIDLQLHLYRDLGVRMLPKDGKFTTAMLTNDKTHKVNSVDITKGYSPYYLAKIIWQFIS